MTVKRSLSFTDRHSNFLDEQVSKGVYSSTSASVGAAIEQMMQDEEARQAVLSGWAEDIRARAAMPRSEYVDADVVFGGVLNDLAAATRR
ncbi:hypothetical protein QCN27_19845 [Cereibacter sp. SYSU M97828]|nr:hypothetical protein [Cereibacter flavus]